MKLPPVPQAIKDLTPYEPGKPLEELERELGITNAVKLASNENPLGPSPRAQTAVRDWARNLHRYPDGAGWELRSALAERLGLSRERICLANGSNEVIEFLCRTFMAPGGEAVAAQYAFSMYPKLVQVSGGSLVEAPLKNFTIDLEAILAACTGRTRLIFLNNPHNPAGTAVNKDQMASFLERVPGQVVVVLDEAYIDFADDADCARGLDFLDAGPPVVVMRTFSKSYGLAGLRIGYALGPEEVIALFNRVRQAFNTSIPAQVGALAALGDDEFLRQTREIIRQGREELYRCFESLGLFHLLSQTNFVLVEVGDGALSVADALLKRGVIVRKMASYGLDHFLRISVGLPEENRRFIREFTRLVEKG